MNQVLSNDILQQSGVLFSEYPPGTGPLRQNMIARNRLQSGLSKHVIGIEFDINSGTMHTIKFAIKQNKYISIPNNALIKKEVIDKIKDQIDLLFDPNLKTLISDLNNLSPKIKNDIKSNQLKLDL